MIKNYLFFVAVLVSSVFAGSSNVANLSDIKEAIHFLIKDVNALKQSQTSKEGLHNTTPIEAQPRGNVNKVMANENINDSDADKVILEYLK